MRQVRASLSAAVIFFSRYLPLFLFPAQYLQSGSACIWGQEGRERGKATSTSCFLRNFLTREILSLADPIVFQLLSYSSEEPNAALLQMPSAFYKPYSLSQCEITGIFRLQIFLILRRFEKKVRFLCLLWKSCFPFQPHLGL